MKLFLFASWFAIIAFTLHGVIAAEPRGAAANETSKNPPQLLYEVIPIKYASASEIADALNSLSKRSNPNNDRIHRLLQKASTSGDLPILDRAEAIADVRSNSILIFATRSELDTIKTLVSKLDLVLTQILMEAAVFEVTSPDTKAGGSNRVKREGQADLISAGGLLTNVKTLWTTNFISNDVAEASVSNREGFRYMAKVDADLDAMLKTMPNDKQFQVIQKPRIQTSHATPANIFLGSTVPYGGGCTCGHRAFGAYFPGKQTIDRQEDARYTLACGYYPGFSNPRIGVGLQVTPLLDPDGFIKMQICQTIDEITGFTAITGVGDVPNTKSTQSHAGLTVRDRETFIIGGLSREHSNLPEPSTIKPAFHHLSTRGSGREFFVLVRSTILSNLGGLSASEASGRSN